MLFVTILFKSNQIYMFLYSWCFCVGYLQRTIDYRLPTVAGLFQKGIEPITNVFHRSLVFIMFGENKSNCTSAKDIHPALICCAVMTDALLEEDTHNDWPCKNILHVFSMVCNFYVMYEAQSLLFLQGFPLMLHW